MSACMPTAQWLLRAYARLQPSALERFEALEQLRALWYGFRISVVISDHLPIPGVEHAQDAVRMQAWFSQPGRV